MKFVSGCECPVHNFLHCTTHLTSFINVSITQTHTQTYDQQNLDTRDESSRSCHIWVKKCIRAHIDISSEQRYKQHWNSSDLFIYCSHTYLMWRRTFNYLHKIGLAGTARTRFVVFISIACIHMNGRQIRGIVDGTHCLVPGRKICTDIGVHWLRDSVAIRTLCSSPLGILFYFHSNNGHRSHATKFTEFIRIFRILSLICSSVWVVTWHTRDTILPVHLSFCTWICNGNRTKWPMLLQPVALGALRTISRDI